MKSKTSATRGANATAAGDTTPPLAIAGSTAVANAIVGSQLM